MSFPLYRSTYFVLHLLSSVGGRKCIIYSLPCLVQSLEMYLSDRLLIER